MEVLEIIEIVQQAEPENLWKLLSMINQANISIIGNRDLIIEAVNETYTRFPPDFPPGDLLTFGTEVVRFRRWLFQKPGHC